MYSFHFELKVIELLTLIFELGIKYLSPNSVTYRVTDEGNGFNYREVHALNLTNEFVREHGRGIMLAESIFDKVEYNEIGNSVLLTIFFLETKGKMDL